MDILSLLINNFLITRNMFPEKKQLHEKTFDINITIFKKYICNEQEWALLHNPTQDGIMAHIP